MEEENRMGKTRDVFKIIRETKRTFHVKINKGQNKGHNKGQKW